MKKKKVLVTGAAGFIGYNVAMFFLDNNYDVVGWDREGANNKFPIIKVNMSNEIDLIDELRKYSPDIIIHCAGSADVGKSVKNPELDYEGNVTLTHHLLFAMHALGMENTKFIFLSSAGVYGNPTSLPITEDMQVNPMSPYAVHKVMCEDLCNYFVRNYEMDIKIARIFSAYGAGLKKQIFWDMYKKTQQGELAMFGTGYESRDYIHVNDVAQAIFLIATKKTENNVFNIANGEEVTIRTATEIFARHIGIEKNKISFNGVAREGDPLNWRANISRIEKLGYKKTVEMEKGLQNYIEWCKNNE